MDKKDWRQRLAEKIAESGMSMRSVSREVGHGDGYVHSILKDRKNPNAQVLAQICAVVGTSMPYIFYGYDITAEGEEFLSLFLSSSKSERDAILTLLRAKNDAK